MIVITHLVRLTINMVSFQAQPLFDIMVLQQPVVLELHSLCIDTGR